MTSTVNLKSGAAHADERSPFVAIVARIGYVAKGIVYSVVGGLALASLVGGFGVGEASGTRGAVATIAAQPFGNFLLILMTGGLGAYVCWRVVQAVADTEDKGRGASGWLQRGGILISGFMYLSLAVYAATLTGWIDIPSGGDGGSSSQKELTGRLMSYVWGLWLVGIAGGIFAGVGAYQVYRAVSCKFAENWRTRKTSEAVERFAVRFAQFGIGMRGLTFLLIGGLIVQAAWTADPSKAEGLGQALQTLQEQNYGSALLGAAALGLCCYGAYCLFNAWIRAMTVD